MDEQSLVPLSVTYRKTLSFGQFNSHTAEACVTVQMSSMDNLNEVYQREHAKLRAEVDASLVSPGFIPNKEEYSRPLPLTVPAAKVPVEVWACTPGQQAAIKNLVAAANLPPKEVRALAKKLFETSVEKLDRVRADTFIGELYARVGREVEVVEVGKE